MTQGTGGTPPRLAIMGGTFDPIHLGHLAVAEEAREVFGAQKVLFIPSGRPPHKGNRDVSCAEDRYIMTLLATCDNPHFTVSRYEIDQQGLSYTAKTLQALREMHGPQWEFLFITGADAVLEMLTWHRPEEIFAAAQVVAAHRPGYDLGRLTEVLGPQKAARVTLLASRALEISSSDIRRRVAAHRSIRYLTPAPVVDYIKKTGLYHQANDVDEVTAKCAKPTGKNPCSR